MKRCANSSLLSGIKLKVDVLNQDECQKMHEAAVEVLSDRGIMYDSDEAKSLLADFGAWQDDEGYTHLPRYLVEDCVATIPSETVMHGRTPEDDVKLSRDQVYAANFGEGICILDLETRERRDTVKQDSVDIARVIDTLDNIQIFNRPINPSDVPPAVANLHNIETALCYTSKPKQQIVHSKYQAQMMVKMAKVAAGSEENFKARPPLGANHSSISPLRIPKGACEASMVLAEAGMRNNIIVMPQPGGTSPMSIAGSLVLQNAEFLGFATLLQCVKKGSPMLYGVSAGTMDMRKGLSLVGAPETLLMNAGAANMAKYYNIPSYIAGG